MKNLEELISEIEKAEQGNQALDKKIISIFGEFNDFGVAVCAGYLGIADFTTSTDAALRLVRTYIKGHTIITMTDDGLASGVKIWVFPNGLSEGNEFCVEGIHYDFPMALCIAMLEYKRAIEAT